MGPRTFIIVNPVSGGGRTGRRWPELRRALDPLLDTWDHAFTLGPQDATRLARQAVEQGYEQVVAVGGDGTQHEVVNGLFRVEEDPKTPPEPLRPDLVFVPVRFGTGGDFARHLGLPARLPAAVQHIESGRTRPVDVGVVAFVDRTGAPRRQLFVNVASFGLSGLVDQKVNASTKRLGGLSFLSATFRALAEFRPVRAQIRVDGQPFYEGRVVTAAAANGTTYGGGMRVAPRACIDDGLLDLVVQTRAGPYETVRVRQLYDGRSAEWPSVRIGRGRVIEAETPSRQPVLLDVDGEALGVLPVRFEVVPGSLRLKAP